MLLFVDFLDVLKFWIGVVELFWLFVGLVVFICMDIFEWDKVVVELVDVSDIEFVLFVVELVEWILIVVVEMFLLLFVRFFVIVWVVVWFLVVLFVVDLVEWILIVVVEIFLLFVMLFVIVWVVWWILVVELMGDKFEEFKKFLLVVVLGDLWVVNDLLFFWRVGLVEKVEVGGLVILFVVVWFLVEMEEYLLFMMWSGKVNWSLRGCLYILNIRDVW